jgi:DNA-binding transcriptional LysR family regulator
MGCFRRLSPFGSAPAEAGLSRGKRALRLGRRKHPKCLLKNRAPITRPADCLAFPLLHDFNRQDWPLWFEAHGVTAPHAKKGPAFSESHLIARAAVAGQGLALVRDAVRRFCDWLVEEARQEV